MAKAGKKPAAGKSKAPAKAVKAKVAKPKKSEVNLKSQSPKASNKAAKSKSSEVSGKKAMEKKEAVQKISIQKVEKKVPDIQLEPEVVVNDTKSLGENVIEAKKKDKEKPVKVKIDKGLQNLSEKSLGELQKKWQEYKEKFGKEKAPNYSMSNSYEPLTPLQHKILGWGYVVSVLNDRLEVLFESGSKILISNYKSK